jgi:hypothetical protein
VKYAAAHKTAAIADNTASVLAAAEILRDLAASESERSQPDASIRDFSVRFMLDARFQYTGSMLGFDA